MAILNGTNKADTILGTAQSDDIFGDNGNDRIDGGAGNDRLLGENGDDVLSGGLGDDVIDGGNGNDMLAGGAGNDDIRGGNGQDTLTLAGNRSDFRFLAGPNGSVIVRDLRANGAEGTDRLFNMEQVKLADGTFKLADLISVNVAPIAKNDVLTLSETAGKTEIGSILLANDSDADGDALIVSSVQAVSARGAAVGIGPDGKVSYDAGSIFADLDDGETATDSFTYTISDGQGHVSTATATATVTITGVTQNVAPVAGNDQLSLAEDAGAVEISSILLGNDSDPDGDSFQVTSAQAVSDKGALVSVGPDGKVRYDAGKIFTGLEDGETATDAFTYTITDAHGLTSTATATVTIVGKSPPNGAPVAVNDQLTLSETAGKTEITSVLLANDSDPDGDVLAVSSVQAVSAQGAAVSIGPDGKVSYDAGSIFAYLNKGQTATDSFTYTVTDGKGHVSTATATMTINGVTQSSVLLAVDDSFEVEEDSGAVDVTAVLLANDSAPAGETFQITYVQDMSDMGALVTIGQNGFVTYDPGELFSWLEEGDTATDSFIYMITDSDGRTSTATATVTINGVTPEGEGPGYDTQFTINEDDTESILAEIVDRFDFAVVGIDTTDTLGTVHFDRAQGVLTFTADHPSSDPLNWDLHQMTSFTVIGPEGQRKVVGIRIAGSNDHIVAVDDNVAIGEGQTTGNLWDSLIANDIDPDETRDLIEILSVGTAGTLGLVIFDADSESVTYSAAGLDLAPGETLVDSFTYTVKDSYNTQDTATVFVTVTGGPNGGASLSMAGGESVMSAFLPAGAGMSHLDDCDFAGFASMQEMLVADSVVA